MRTAGAKLDIVAKHDRFGYEIDPVVSYARGNILRSEVEESAKQKHAFEIARMRFRDLGEAGVYNLTGLIRGFPLTTQDVDRLRSYIHFAVNFDGEFERLAIEMLGGDYETHDAFLATRCSAGMLAIMLSLLRENEEVLSLVPADRSHPSVRQAVVLARGGFKEVIGVNAFLDCLREKRTKIAVITTVTPSKHYLPAGDIARAIEGAKREGAVVILDDAHMAARISLHDEPPALALGPADIVVWSLAKHMIGPRCGVVAGRRELVKSIRARALAVGLEAQPAQVLAGLRAMEQFNPEPIRDAERLARTLFDEMQPLADGRLYMAGAGVGLSGEDLLSIVRGRSGQLSHMVPIEAVSFMAIRLLELTGAITISSFGIPGAASAYRLLLYPDGQRIGLNRILQGTQQAFSELVASHADENKVRSVILGVHI